MQENRKEFNFEGFTAYLRTPTGGYRNKATAQSITSDLIMFFNTTPIANSDIYNNIDSLFDKTTLESFLCHIKIIKNYKATTITEKIRRLKLAIQYIMDLHKSDDYYSRGNILLNLLTKRCHSLSQDVSRQRKGNLHHVDEDEVMVCK